MDDNQTQTQQITEVENSNIQSQIPVKEQGFAIPKLQVVDEEESSAEDFRAYFEKSKKGYVITLPSSGLKVRTTNPDMMNMILQGKLPQEMLKQALQLKGLAPKTSIDQMSQEDLKKLSTLVND